MDERDFVTKKREAWDQLAALIAKANGRQGVRALERAEVLALGPLYRRASSDLAYARAHAISADLVVHLNSLVGRAHALLYEAETSGNPFGSVREFYLNEFPKLLQRHLRYFLAAVFITALGGAFAYWVLINHPEKTAEFIPAQFKESLDVWKSGKIATPASATMSSALMINNLGIVGLLCFASGIVGSLPTLWLLFTNGMTLGAFAAVMTQFHRHATFWPGILPHGIAELTGIFICGAAGFLLGMSVLLPGQYTRRDALRLAGRDAIKLVLGTVPLFVFAGIIEGMFSHLDTPAGLRYAFAGVNGVIWYLYLFIPRREPPVSALTPGPSPALRERGESIQARNLPALESVER